MTVDKALSYAKKKIHSDYAKLLLADLLSLNPLELLLHLQDEVPKDKLDIYYKEVEAISDGKPIQYAIGHINFLSNQFIINNNVLIPRFETEELVEKTIIKAKELFNKPLDIIDLGTGSGVIGISLEKNLDTNNVDLIDISKDALEVAKINKDKLKSKANLIENNMLEGINNKYDIIISNPPYIKEDEEIEDIVKDNEPHIALYGGKDGLDYYKDIAKNLKNVLKDKSLIAFEIGCDQGEDIKNILLNEIPNLKIEILKDMQDRDRFIFGIFDKLN